MPKATKEEMVASEEELVGLQAKLEGLEAERAAACTVREECDTEVAAEKAVAEEAESKAAAAKAAADVHRDGIAVQTKAFEDKKTEADARTAELNAEAEQLTADRAAAVEAHNGWKGASTATTSERDATHSKSSTDYMSVIDKLRAALASADADVATVRGELGAEQAAAVDAALTKEKETARLTTEIQELEKASRRLSKQTEKADAKSRHWQMLASSYIMQVPDHHK